jgi:hypothetical protein
MGNTDHCESCFNYVYDEEYDCYICQVNLDEDDLGKFLRGYTFDCPYFQLNDEYKIVKKQYE